MFKYLFVFCLLTVACTSKKVQTSKNILNTSDIENYSDTDTTYIEQGVGPIVLFKKDLMELGVEEIEIKKTLNNVKYRYEKVLISFVVNFNREGVFNGFNVYEKKRDNNWYEVVYVTAHRSQGYQLSVEEGYSKRLFDNDEENYKLKFMMSPNIINNVQVKSILNKLEYKPFIGENGYLYSEKKGVFFVPNTIIYKKINGVNDKSIGKIWFSKKLKSDSINTDLFQIISIYEQPWKYHFKSIIKINSLSRDTINKKYYYYGENPMSTYNLERKKYFEEEINDSIEVVITHNENTIFRDSVYNSKRWMGFTNNCDYLNSIGRGYYDEQEEIKIIDDLFNKKNVTVISKNDFYINGVLGYNYLLDAYNNRKILIKENIDNKYDKKGNIIPDKYKKQKEIEKVKVIPKKILVQTTLTDFWMIQLTE